MHFRIILFLPLILSLSFSAYLKDVPQKIKQPDGSIIDCFSSGDEFYNWVHDKDGYTIVRSEIDGFCYYANEDLSPSSHRVGQANPAVLGIRKWIKYICMINWIIISRSKIKDRCFCRCRLQW